MTDFFIWGLTLILHRIRCSTEGGEKGTVPIGSEKIEQETTSISISLGKHQEQVARQSAQRTVYRTATSQACPKKASTYLKGI